MTQTAEQPVKHEYDRIPYLVAYQNNSAVRDVYGGVAELVVLESYLLRPKDKPSDTVLVFMHPIGGGAYLPMINGLARAGHHVIYCNSRFRGTDSALLMEKVVEDLGECIKDAKNRLGYDKVVLAEQFIGGGEYTAAVLGNETLPFVKIEPATEFYDYQAKYFRDDTVYRCPSGLSAEREAEIGELVKKAFWGIGGRSWGRVDFLMDEAGKAYLLEVNTAPGMTSHSLFPMAAKARGISYEQLVLQILATTLAG